ncbi:hypothetical protein ACO0RG_003811 [Hanseniaspora osmophila]|uniref:Uncharacterized protein n=1 Tax=Hanseniaspora osmophila TaxID=56408 RepID=A0A1E5RF84_9ASCO|nr:hypothetical protein AWRI3579_g2450 [Hanseniaspora osmophila]
MRVIDNGSDIVHIDNAKNEKTNDDTLLQQILDIFNRYGKFKNDVSFDCIIKDEELLFNTRMEDVLKKLSILDTSFEQNFLLQNCNQCFHDYNILLNEKINFLINTWDLPIFNALVGNLDISIISNIISTNNTIKEKLKFHEKICISIFNKCNGILKDIIDPLIAKITDLAHFIIEYITSNGIQSLYLENELLLLFKLWSLTYLELLRNIEYYYIMIMKSRLLIILYELLKFKRKILYIQTEKYKEFKMGENYDKGIGKMLYGNHKNINNHLELIEVLKKYCNMDGVIIGYGKFIIGFLNAEANMSEANMSEASNSVSSTSGVNTNTINNKQTPTTDLTFNDCVDLFNDIEKMYLKLKSEMDMDFQEENDSMIFNKNRLENTSQLPNMQALFNTNKTVLDELPNLMNEFGVSKTGGKENVNISKTESVLDQVDRLGVD